ncbi:hypothetical protein SUGI_1054460 [Cryptomeria japonica]|nr:hypothetical protein SUGI_1054460 [Cryptomeria japonica]
MMVMWTGMAVEFVLSLMALPSTCSSLVTRSKFGLSLWLLVRVFVGDGVDVAVDLLSFGVLVVSLGFWPFDLLDFLLTSNLWFCKFYFLVGPQVVALHFFDLPY